MLSVEAALDGERGRCHHFIDDDGKPAGCPAAPVASGWRQDYQVRWYPVGARAGLGRRLQLWMASRTRSSELGALLRGQPAYPHWFSH